MMTTQFERTYKLLFICFYKKRIMNFAVDGIFKISILSIVEMLSQYKYNLI